MTQSLKDKVAVVTGAARNMGRAFSEMLANEGVSLVIHYRSSDKKADVDTLVSTVEAAGGETLVVQADLTNVQEIKRLFNEAAQKFGKVDIFINTAGMVIKKPFVDITEEDYDKIFAINSKAAFFCMSEATKHMADGGRIINLGTTLLGATTGYYSIYAGSKAPLEDFTRALAKEVGSRGITVNTVAPGPIDTSFFHPAETPESVEWLKQQSITGELGKVEDVVPMVQFLVSPQARWVTAQTIFVNGGFVAR